MKGMYLDRSKWEAQKQNLRRQMDAQLITMKDRVETASILAAREVANRLAKATMPDSSKPFGFAAISVDIGRIFITASQAYSRLSGSTSRKVAGAFFAAYKSGDLTRAVSTLRRQGGPLAAVEFGHVDRALHQAARRGANGRVTTDRPLRIVPDEELRAYIREVQGHLGEAASGWAACAALLGGEENVAAWKSTRVHGMSHGAVEIIDTGGKVIVKLRNYTEQVNNILDPSAIPAAVDAGIRKFEEYMTRAFSEAF